jgi:hypothetical protein
MVESERDMWRAMGDNADRRQKNIVRSESGSGDWQPIGGCGESQRIGKEERVSSERSARPS